MKKKLLLFLTMIAWLFQVEASPSYYFNPYFYNNYDNIHQQESEDKIEAYLQNQVPGLNVSYREVIDAMIKHGFEILLKGGVIRDLISYVPSHPQDIDLGYTGNADELEEFLKEKGWMYTRKPNGWMIIIGDHRSSYIEAVPIMSQDFGENSNDYKEFTLNSINYHCNSKSFFIDSDQGLRDLSRDRIRILSSDWKKWLTTTVTRKYYKIFRFWKMVGKGYVFEAKFSDFIAKETKRILKEDREEFINQVQLYLGNHYKSFDDVYHGCIAVMGYNWARKYINFFRNNAAEKSRKLELERDQYTNFINKND